ncbi:Holliday junction resolvase-like protein [Treponema sp.]|uniref:Holliday junction resolvase-like protein n=1 Tax=Treponema sp. TaxID=166 RepID=UPI002A7FD89A|nr:Holliday junction resolvase-like protein [Treponema sp.]MCI6442448.1 Holliday junction resolvase [Spirochaetia bacterium]MDY4133236.1 Holliday junction resolvase-like protein [Treponema sp.]
MHDFLTINHLALILVTVAVFLAGVFLGRLIQKLKDLSLLKKQRKDAVKKSRAVIGGQVAEQLAPYLPEFPCNPGDVCFLGKPVDFIGFTGLTESDEIHEVMFIEVKTGQSKLNGHEKQLKDAIQKGRVRYVEYNPSL